jgi:phage shock protein E
MHWIFIILVAMALLVLLPRLSWIPTSKAVERLKAGAVLVDVRSPAEFASQRIPGAINLPMGFGPEDLRREGLEPGQEILLHCASGTRSGMARGQLRKLGYEQVWNLGSFGRAKKVASEAGQGV